MNQSAYIFPEQKLMYANTEILELNPNERKYVFYNLKKFVFNICLNYVGKISICAVESFDLSSHSTELETKYIIFIT